MSGWGRTANKPVRSCVGCRRRLAQDALARFVRTAAGWRADVPAARRKQPGRGAYLCSLECAQRARKNKRYPGLGAAAAEYGLIIREPMQEMNS